MESKNKGLNLQLRLRETENTRKMQGYVGEERVDEGSEVGGQRWRGMNGKAKPSLVVMCTWLPKKQKKIKIEK